MKVLIIGGLGFIGSNLALKLIKEGHVVSVLDNFSKCNFNNYEDLKSKCNIKIGSIYSIEDLEKALDNVEIVYNLASPQMIDCQKNSTECYNTNILGLEYLLDIMLKKSIRKLIFSSTTSVYLGDGINFCEEDEIFANDNYTLSKMIAEKMIIEFSFRTGIDYCIFRNAPVYGQRQFLGDNGSGITMKIMSSLYTNSLLNLYSYGKPKKEFLYVDDVVHFYYLALSKGKGVYNLSNNLSIPIVNVVNKLKQITGKSGNINYLTDGYVYTRSFLNNKLINDFGKFTFTILDEGLLKTLDWYKEVISFGK